jgi:hypothetical protein
MFLTYQQYLAMGGSLNESDFNKRNRKAESLIRSQSGGQTGNRIDKMASVPQAIVECVYDLIDFLTDNANSTLTSESQSSGGVSESYSYNVNDKEEVEKDCIDIIYDEFYGAKLGYLLYLGCDV